MNLILAQPALDEPGRIEALRQYAALDTLREQALDDLTALAGQICEAPIALISLVDEKRQWIKATFGLKLTETPREFSFCGHAVQQHDLLIVPDTLQDERFRQNPLVSGEAGVRFCAAAPLVSPRNVAFGALCVMDRLPRTLTPAQEQSLQVLARQVTSHLELRLQAHELAESEGKFRLLAENISDVFWITSPDFQRVLYVSPGYNRVWGRSAEDLYARSAEWVEAIITGDRARVLGVFAALMDNQQSVSVEYQIERPDGSLRWVQNRGFQVRNANGDLARLTGIVSDITERKQAEIASLRLAAIVEFSDDAIIGKDLNSIVTSWNKGAEKIFGYSESEMVGTSIMRLIPDDRRDEEAQILGKIICGKSVEHFETLRQTKDGRLINVSVTASPIKDPSGKPIGASKVARDITGRKQEEAARRISEARYAALFEHAPDGILIADPQSRYIDANASICRMLGYTRDEMIGLRASDIVTAGELPQIDTALSAIKSQFEYHREWQFRRKDGSSFSADVIATTMPDGNLLGMIRDSTEKNAAQAQIAEQAALLDKARDAILVGDLAGNILFWNHGAELMYGWGREEVIGRNVGELLYSDPATFEECNRLAISKGEWSGELQHVTRSHGEISVESRWTLIRDNEGHPKSMLTINTDIRERKSIEAQLMRAQRMESIGTLAGGIAHDLNNILAPIMMSIDVLKSSAESPVAKRMLDTIEVSAQRGADIVRQVLSFARGAEGERIEVQPKHLLKDLESIVTDTFPKDIQLNFSIPVDTWTIMGDPTQVHQILLNLCVNARDAMPGGGSLSVSVENCVLDDQYTSMHIEAKAGRYVILSVSDSGTGISQRNLDKIFMPFFTTKALNKGTGLGLSTVAAIVKGHGGFVNVYSELGKGTTFKIYLPATEISSGAGEQHAGDLRLPRGNGETILVVDDESSILTITSQTLQAFGYRVLTASDGADAVAVYVQNQNEIAVVLTDMMMPVMDGAATIHALARINPKAKIIAASGLDSYGALVKASGAGIKYFLTKPYTAQTLLESLRVVLDETCD